MNLSAIKSAGLVKIATQTLGRSSVVFKKYSPEILTGIGVVGTITSTVLASRATLHLETNVDFHKAEVDFIKDQLHSGDISANEYQKGLVKIHLATATRLARLYGPAVTLGVASIGCLLGAHGIMKKRNVALAAAYKTVEQSFSEYRKRVVDELGEEKDRDFRFPSRDVEVKNEETGETTTRKVVSPEDVSGYAKFFDEFNSNWKNNAEMNLFFLKCKQSYLNDLLQARGHVFLNEVYDELGMERTKQGAVVGWVIGKDGDNYIDFGMYNSEREMARHFINGNEASILLDFNVDGVILDKI